MSDVPYYEEEGNQFSLGQLGQSERQQLVDLSGNQATGSAYVDAKDFVLSPLGANLDLLGQWASRPNGEPGVPGTNIQEWQQITQEGRDNHVKIVYGGYLFPLGHLATLTTVTNRILVADPVNPSAYADAYLQQHSFIRVTQHKKYYPAPGQPYGLGAWPFSEVEILTKVTPDLLEPGLTATPLVSTWTDHGHYPQAFIPQTQDGAYFPFSFHMIDDAGTVVSMHMPLVFFFGRGGSDDPLLEFSESQIADVVNMYNSFGQSGDPMKYATSTIAGTHIKYSPEVSVNGVNKAGATTHPTLSITLGCATPSKVPSPVSSPTPGGPQDYPPVSSPVQQQQLSNDGQPAFYPSLMNAYIRLPAAETLSRAKLNDGQGPGGVGIFPYSSYVTGGFGAAANNKGSVYAGLLNPPNLKFPSDAVGGLANPNIGVAGLSAAAGAVGGQLDTYAKDAVGKISEYFGGLLDANFLGGLKLSDILGGLTGLFGGDNSAPELTRMIGSDGTVTVTYTLSAELAKWPSSTPIFEPVNASGAQFNLTATIVIAPLGSTTFDVKGSIDGFTIDILESFAIIQIPFGDATTKGATFESKNGKKPDIKVNVGQPTFLGVLDFVNTLQQFLSDIGGSGVSIDVGPTQISAAISLSLPSVGCGVFSLDNLALSAKVVVPFLGDPTIATFGFCSQEQPFALTVMCFGGGGYLLVSVGFTEMQSLTASFDFEGQLALDLGVASGGIAAMAGITFNYDATNGSTLTGFVKLTGELEVLGIISVSITLLLTLSYASKNNVATGTATMTISVSLCFFSISVPITVQKQFSGPTQSNPQKPLVRGAKDQVSYDNTSQLSFADQYDINAWSDYCNAFAA
jgi:hypothetical protein